MKTYDDRTADVAGRIQIMKRKRRVMAAACLSLALVIVAALVMVPFGNPNHRPNASYNDLIAKLEPVVSKHTNSPMMPDATFGGITSDPMVNEGDYTFDASGSNKDYVEVTDNQVAGVTESDIFKRTTEHIFYLRGQELSVFSIAGEDSARVSTFTVSMEQTAENLESWGKLRYCGSAEMYLSKDCATITVMMNANYQSMGTCTVLVSLDVSDPANVVEKGRIYVTGSYLSSRLVDGQILLMSSYKLNPNKVDFDDLSTFVPQIICGGETEFIAAEDILYPETLSNCAYTTICLLDEKTLDVQDKAACLSYSQDVYVSQDKIFVARSYSERVDGGAPQLVIDHTMTEIAGISYAGGNLEVLGSIALDGSIKDQYSMDELDGILRVVTSTNETHYEKYGGEHIGSIRFLDRKRNVNLYCVDLAKWEIAASVIAFAPNGEDAQSVRFDGEKAYVCTAEVIVLTDPVYFFDLSDINNITWTDTGTIDGYSTSLIQLQDGYLLGIGYGSASDQLKIEVYMEENGSVVSVCAYELFASFSEEYKSYFIDRENNLFGLAVKDRDGNCRYLLLHFDGYQLNVLAQIPLHADGAYLNSFRACMADGYLYVIGTGYEIYRGPNPLKDMVVFAVEKIW